MYCTECGFKISDDAKFCSSCGHRQTATTRTSVDEGASLGDGNESGVAGNFEEIATATPCYFQGRTSEFLSNAFAELMDVKKGRRRPSLIYNIYGSPDLIIVIPVAKHKTNKLPLLGLMLGTGGLGAGAFAALEGVSRKRQLEQYKTHLDNDSPLKDALIFKSSNLKVDITQKIEVLNFNRKETWFNFTGEGLFQGKEYKVDFEFGEVGKAEDTIADLCRLLAINSPVIKKKRML